MAKVYILLLRVGQVGPGGLKPGSGAGRYVKSGSNPLGGAQGRAGQPGGVVGSVTPGGARRIGGVEPQAVVNPQTFRKGQQLFQKVQGGAYPKSPTAARIRQQAQQAGFKPGQSNIPASQMPGLDLVVEYVLVVLLRVLLDYVLLVKLVH